VNPVALITGASRGIGRGIALELAAIGYDLIINFVSSTKDATATADACLARAKKQGHNIKAAICQGDISTAIGRQKTIDFTRSEFQRLDLLVNNAGIAPTVRADLLDTSEESFDRLLNVNAKGPFFLTQLAARWMVEQARTMMERQLTQLVRLVDDLLDLSRVTSGKLELRL